MPPQTTYQYNRAACEFPWFVIYNAGSLFISLAWAKALLKSLIMERIGITGGRRLSVLHSYGRQVIGPFQREY